MPDISTMAKVGAPHGVRGDLKLYIFSEADLSAFDVLWIQYPSKKHWEPMPAHRMFSRGLLDLIHFENWDDRDEARRFTNALIGVDVSALPPADTEHHEYYWSTLVGLTVINLKGVTLGVVDHLFETGANDVMVVKAKDRERLLPFVDAVILNVDEKAKVMTVDWDEDF